MHLRKNRTYTLPLGAILGGGYAFGWTLLSAGILAWLIRDGYLREEAVGYGSMGILLIGSILGAAVGYRKVQRRRMLTCICSGGAYLMMLLAITALFFGGQYTGMGVTALLILGGSATAAFLGMEKGRRRSSGGRKIRV